MIVFFADDGSTHIRWNMRDGIPDHATIEKLAETIKAHKKSPTQSGNSEQGSTTETAAPKGHFEDTTAAALRQETMEILSQLPPEDVEEITQQARDMIKGRA